MTSQVNPSNINGNFPIAGQDNDSQGFRDNFTNIRNNLTFTKSELEDLQGKVVLKSALIGTTLNNDFQGAKVNNLQVSNLTETMKDWGSVGGGTGTTTTIQLDLAEGNVNKIYAVSGSTIAINGVIKNWPASLQWTRILIYFTVPDTTVTLQVPQFTTDLSSIPNLRRVAGTPTITYTDAGTYVYELSSTDSGASVIMRELTVGNPEFRDPNFYTVNIGAGSVIGGQAQRSGYQTPSLLIGFGNLLGVGSSTSYATGVPYAIDTTLKAGNDSFLIRGSMSSYQRVQDNSALNASQGTRGTSDYWVGSDSLQSAGFSTVADRTTVNGQTVTFGSGAVVQGGDLIGYYNSVGYTYHDLGHSLSSYQVLGTMEMVAAGSSTSPYGIGGNIYIKTKGDGTTDTQTGSSYYNYAATQGQLRTAMLIDNLQNVTIYGNLDVKGLTTTVESVNVTIQDKNIILAQGAAEGVAPGNYGSGITIYSGTPTVKGQASLTYDSVGVVNIGNPGWVVNQSLLTLDVTDYTVANTGSFVTYGGAYIGKNLGVGGAFTLTSTTESTSTTTGAFILSGGLGIAKNVSVGGELTLLNNGNFANANATSATTGLLNVTGGAGIAGNLFVGGLGYSGSAMTQWVAGSGVNVVNANVYATTGNAFIGNLAINTVTGTFVDALTWDTGGASPAYSLRDNNQRSLGALRVGGGATVQGNVFVGQGATNNFANVYTTSPTSAIYVNNGSLGYPNHVGAGGLVLGNTSSPVGATVTGLLNVGNQGSSGGIFIAVPNTVTSGTLPVTRVIPGTPLTGNSAIAAQQNGYGSLTNLGGTNLLGDVHIGQYYSGSYYASGVLFADSGLVSTDQTTGAIVVSSYTLANGYGFYGGAGVAGNVNAGQSINSGTNATFRANTYANILQTSEYSSVGTAAALNVSGGAAVAKGVYVGGNLSVLSNVYIASNAAVTGNLSVGSFTTLVGNVYTSSNLRILGNLALGAGTVTSAPINLTAGSLLNTTANGAIEYDSANLSLMWSGIASDTGRTIVDAAQFFYLGASMGTTIGATLTSPYGISPTLSANHVYEFEYYLLVTNSSTGAITLGWAASAGSATPFYADVQVEVINTVGTSTGITGVNNYNTITAKAITGGASAATQQIRIRGFCVKTTASGRLTLQASVASGTLTTQAGSWFKFTDRGLSTAGTGNVAIGNMVQVGTAA